MREEIWKDVEGYSKYEVSSEGSIRDKTTLEVRPQVWNGSFLCTNMVRDDGVDYIFHAAALKQVPSCEFFPMEAVKTNIIGTENVLDAAIFHKVKKVVVLSTDKAVYPINAMGISKAMMEKVAISKSRESSKTVICITRYGNVLCSRGSVVPLFFSQLKRGEDLTVTNRKGGAYHGLIS